MKQLLILLFATPFLLSGQSPLSLVQDINPGTASSRTSSPGIAFQGRLIFPATTPDAGSELWVSDGTDDGTQLLIDIVSGAVGSSPEDLIVVGDVFFFTAETSATGRELYRSDGTATGTTLVTDIQPGTASSIPDAGSRSFVSYNDRLYFAAAASGDNVELWSADSGNAFLLQELQSGSRGSYPDNFTIAGALLFFTADDGITGKELWYTTGNPAATFRYYDAYPGGFSGSPSGLTAVDDKLFFLADNSFAAGDLYVSDLSTNTTQRVFDFAGRGTALSTNTSRSPMVRIGNNVVFAAENGNGPDLWISDGTEGGTRVLLDNPEVSFGAYTPQFFVSVGDYVYFKDEIPGQGIELWRTDGTTEGTILTKDLNSGFFDSFALPSYIHAHQGVLYFNAKGDVVGSIRSTGFELYTSDGTPEGTVLVADISEGTSDSDPNNFVSVGDQLFFFADDGTNGQELYVLTGPPAIPPLSVDNVSENSVRCSGQSNGSLDFTVSGGVPPYQAEGQTSETGAFFFSNLTAGDYDILVTDARDSTILVFAFVAEPTPLSIILSELTGQNSLEGGSIFITPSGGTRGYSFSWADTSLTSNDRENLDFGDYTITLTDANGCSISQTFTVEDLTSVRELDQADFRIFPSPATDHLTVALAGSERIEQVACYDLTGRQLSVKQGHESQTLTLSAADLPQRSGLFIVVITAHSGARGVRPVTVIR
jgi:ELWxxDGT repeat protein